MARRQGDAFLRVGLPMVILVTGGSVILSQLLQGKYDIKVWPAVRMIAFLPVSHIASARMAFPSRKRRPRRLSWACKARHHRPPQTWRPSCRWRMLFTDSWPFVQWQRLQHGSQVR
jgi:hypothetical protein